MTIKHSCSPKCWKLFNTSSQYDTAHLKHSQCPISTVQHQRTRGRYHGGRRMSTDDSQTVIPSSALDKPTIMKRYHRRRTCSHTSPRCSPTMVTLHDTGFVECRWWKDGWTENCHLLTVVGLHDTGPWALFMIGIVSHQIQDTQYPNPCGPCVKVKKTSSGGMEEEYEWTTDGRRGSREVRQAAKKKE